MLRSCRGELFDKSKFENKKEKTMGRMLGAFDNPEELDRPDLNKCPDCECFFAGDNCPLCGKVCPEEMRAGNRKPPKKTKRRRGSSNRRVTFVEWYHSWWFIIIMLVVMPIAGIILLFTSPHRTLWKVLITLTIVLVEFVIPGLIALAFALTRLESAAGATGIILTFLM
jgi:hypothetical protein